MLKAYSETWLRNLEIQEAAQTWQKRHLLSDEQLKAIQNAHPQAFYRPNIFIKIGLFIFTLLACGFTSSFVTLFMSFGLSENLRVWATFIAIICGIGFWFVLQYVIVQRKVLYAGVDNALIYSLVGAIGTVMLVWFLESRFLFDAWFYLALVLPILVWATLRYAETLVSVSAYLCVLLIVCLLLMKVPVGKLILPFVVMIWAGLSYWLAQKWSKEDRYFYYHHILQIIEGIALILFYLGGNYLVVREGNAAIEGFSSQQIAFAPLFYFFSTAIPVMYIFFGLKNQNRIHLIIGLLALAFSIYTYRTYFSVLPLEYALTLGGILMIVGAVVAIRYLKTPQYGISYQPELSDESLNLESIIVNQVVGQAPKANDDLQFGGGQYGGGGAGDNY